MVRSRSNDDEVIFAPEDEVGERNVEFGDPWKVLIVDDDEDIHLITKMILKQISVKGRTLSFFNAYSALDAKKMIIEHQNCPFDLILLDIVMENDDAGYQVARYLRKELGERSTKIVIRTGQPGIESKNQDLAGVRIDGFHLKTELSAARLRDVVFQALSC